MKTLLLSVLAALLFASACFAQSAVTDPNGRLIALRLQGRSIPLTSDLRIAVRGEAKQPGLADATAIQFTRESGVTRWIGSIEIAPGKRYGYEQTMQESGGEVKLTIKLTAQADVDADGAYLRLDVPVESFAGGLAEMYRGAGLSDEGWAALSKHTPVTAHHQPAERQWTVLRGNPTDRIVLTDAEENMRLEVKLERAVTAVIKDTRETKGSTFSCQIPIAPKLKAGESASMQVTIKPTLLPGRSQAKLTVDTSKALYKLDGFGGNYCFNSGTPVTKYTLENLKSAWARTEMSLEQWVLEEGKVTPDKIDWAYLEAQDKPGSNLRREFLTAQQVQAKGIPYVITIWDIPTWLYADPQRPSYVHKNKWPELAALIGSYLVYAKRQYGIEPDLFSFNEPDSGVRVKLTPEDHREQIKILGAHFKSLGLKTKMLLADVVSSHSHGFTRAAAEDPEAMKYVGAIAFHCWGRLSVPAYEKWGELARELKLPLLVTELGTDVNAWRDKSFSTSGYHYALGEMRRYQDLLIHARPQGTMHWEFTKDYGLVDTSTAENGDTIFKPTSRFYFIKQFCNLTPHKSDALATITDTRSIMFTAFAGKVDGKQAYTLHISNMGGGTPRKARITGIPVGVTSLRAVITSEKDNYRELEPVKVADGAVELELAPESLLTLTTMP